MITVVLLVSLNVLLGLMGVVGFTYIMTESRKVALILGVASLVPILMLNFYLVGHPIMISP